MPRNYILLARVASSTHPDQAWEVSTDGQDLTCNCPRWRFPRNGVRSCRHTDEVRPRVEALGGLDAVLRMLRERRSFTQEVLEGQTAVARVETLRRLRPGEACDLECGNRFATGHERCRHERTVKESMASLLATAPTAAPQRDVDWLGGGRAIILRG